MLKSNKGAIAAEIPTAMGNRGPLTGFMLSVGCVAGLATPCYAEEDSYTEIGGWAIYRNETTCAAFASFKDDEYVGISYDASDQSTRVVFTDVDASSLKAGDKRSIDMLILRANGSLDDGWTSIDFTVTLGEDNRRIFSSIDLQPPALDDLKKGRTVGFFYKDKRIASYSLAGTAKALGEVERCSMQLHRINPKDVFAGEATEQSSIGSLPLITPEPGAPHGPLPIDQSRWAARIQENYPSKAVREGIQGAVTIELSVNAQGQVSGCSIVLSSGSEVLDLAACDGARRYARFRPAVDEGANPIASVFTTTVQYRLN